MILRLSWVGSANALWARIVFESVETMGHTLSVGV